MGDVRKYNDVKIVNTEDGIEKLSKKEDFKRWHIYNENMASVLMEKTSVTLYKPRYIGSAILALSKTVMYEFHYSYMAKKFKDCKLLLTDADYFCYSIPYVKDVYAAIKDSAWFDFSNFLTEHANLDMSNKMVPGKFKNESPNNTILEFVGLRFMMYSILPLEKEKKGYCQGCQSECNQEGLKHNDYKTCLMYDEQVYHKMVKIRHAQHQLEPQNTLKKSLSPFNDKKWIQKNGSDFITCGFGHNKIYFSVKKKKIKKKKLK